VPGAASTVHRPSPPGRACCGLFALEPLAARGLTRSSAGLGAPGADGVGCGARGCLGCVRYAIERAGLQKHKDAKHTVWCLRAAQRHCQRHYRDQSHTGQCDTGKQKLCSAAEQASQGATTSIDRFGGMRRMCRHGGDLCVAWGAPRSCTHAPGRKPDPRCIKRCALPGRLRKDCASRILLCHSTGRAIE